MENAPFDLARAHRWFAVELNNLAWEIVENPERSSDDIDRMIHAAHGTCFHWGEVGTLLNHLRAQCLLAAAYAAAGIGESAVRHAERCLALSREAADTQTPFDRASAHGCASAAYAAAGRLDAARDAHRRATSAAAKCQDPEEKSLLARLYPAP